MLIKTLLSFDKKMHLGMSPWPLGNTEQHFSPSPYFTDETTID